MTTAIDYVLMNSRTALLSFMSESSTMTGQMSVNILKNNNIKLRKSDSESVEFQTEFYALFFCVLNRRNL